MVLVLVFLRLSEWQLDRLSERRAENALVETNEQAEPAAVADVLTPDRPAPANAEWRTVTVTGRYDAEHELFVRYRHYEGEPGFHVLTPLVAADGSALIVDRGWLPQRGSVNADPEVAPPPTGEVRVTGRVRLSEDGNVEQVRPETGQVRFIKVPVLADWLQYPVYGGYVELTEQDPSPSEELMLVPAPELDEGPHLSYAVQWVIFAIIAVGGVGFLAYDAVRGGRLRDRLRDREYARSTPPAPAEPPPDKSVSQDQL